MRRVPWTLVVFVVGLVVPFLGSRFYTFVATDIVILALFAMSLNLLLGYTGLVSFGHAAYFGIGAYTCALLMKSAGAPFLPSLLAAGVMAAAFALVFGFFCVRLTRIYFAMLTLAFAQIVWAICFKWNDVTGGEQGLPSVPYPEMGWMGSLPVLGNFKVGDQFYLTVLVIVALCFAALQAHRRFPLRPRADGAPRQCRARAVYWRERQGLSARRIRGGRLLCRNRWRAVRHLQSRRVPGFLLLDQVGGAADHDYPRRHGGVLGPAVGAAAFILLNQQITSYTQYWPFVMGTTLIVLLYAFPGGIAGTLHGRDRAFAAALRPGASDRSRDGESRCSRLRAYAKSSTGSPPSTG